MSESGECKEVCLVGHPYAPIGMGEHVRCTYRALRSVAIRPSLIDIYKLISPDTDELTEFSGACADRERAGRDGGLSHDCQLLLPLRQNRRSLSGRSAFAELTRGFR